MRTREIPASITAAGTTSGTINLGSETDATMAIAAIFVPAAYDKTTVQFESSLDGAAWAPVITTAGTNLEYTVTASTLQAISVPPVDLCGFRYLRLKAPSAVGATSAFTIIARSI